MAAPEIGCPPTVVRRPDSVRAREKRPRALALAVPAQRTASLACAEAFVPFGAPGGGGLSIATILSSTGAALPAASITLTVRRCAPLPALVESNATSALTD